MKDNKKILIAVYGSLRKSLGNHRNYLLDAKFLGSFNSDPVYSLHILHGSYPGLKENGFTSIKMEVYEVSEFDARRIDSLEGYNPNDLSGNTFYNRVKIKTPYGKARVYIYVPETDSEILEHGDWLKFKQDELTKAMKFSDNL